MMPLKKIINKESAIVLIYTCLSMFGLLIVMKLLTVYLTQEEFGLYSLILSVLAFVGIFPFKALDQAILRYVSIARQANHFNIFYSNFIALFILLSLFYLLIFIMVKIFFSNSNILILYTNHIYALLVTEYFKSSLQTSLAAERQRAKLLLSYALEISFKIGLILYFANSITIEIILYTFIFTNVLSSIYLFLQNKNDFDPYVITRKNFLIYNRKLINFGYPFIIMAIFTWARDMSGRWIIDMYLDKSTVALFSVLTAIAMIIPAGIQTILSSYVVPIIYQRENVQKGFARKITNVIFITIPIFFSTTALIVYEFSDTIISFFATDVYSVSPWILTTLFVSYSFYTLAMFSIYEILANEQSKLLIFPSILSGVVSIASGLILITQYGFEGAIYSYILGYMSYSIAIFVTVFKHRWRHSINNT